MFFAYEEDEPCTFDIISLTSALDMVRVPTGLLATTLLLSAPATGLAQDSDADGVLNANDVFPCDAQSSGVAYAPGRGRFGVTMFEDRWPSAGDLDFNDLVVGWNYALRTSAEGVHRIDATFDLRAVGAYQHLGLALGLPVDAANVARVQRRVDGGAWSNLGPWSEANAVLSVSPDVHAEFPHELYPFINSELSAAAVPAVRVELSIELSAPAALSAQEAPFDLFVYFADDVAHEIHTPEFGGTSRMDQALFGTGDDGSTPGRYFVDTDGLPFALTVSQAANHPAERIAIETAYPDIVAFAASGGTTHTNFTDNPSAEALFPAARPAPLFELPRDGSCLPSESFVLGSGPAVLTGRTVTLEDGTELDADQILRLQRLIDAEAEAFSGATFAAATPLLPHLRSSGFWRHQVLDLPSEAPFEMPAVVHYQPSTWSGDSDSARFVFDLFADPGGSSYRRIVDTGNGNWTSSGWPWNGPMRTAEFSLVPGYPHIRLYGQCNRRQGSYCSAVINQAYMVVNPDLPAVGATLTLQ